MQRRHAWLGFPAAVVRKFVDDRAHNLAALVAYFAFVSIFPLLMVLVTVLDIVLRGQPALRHRLVTSALDAFPVFSEELYAGARPLRETGIALVIGIVGALIGGCGVAAAAQNALNSAWLVPYAARPRMPWSYLRYLPFVAVVGLGQIATGILSGVIESGAGVLGGAGARTGAVLVALAINILVFWTGFRLVTARMVPSRALWTGAIVAGISWQALQILGGYVITHLLARSSSVYGIFGIVLGFLAWLYLQAQITVVAIEIDVVRTRRLWPRSLYPPPLTDQDRRAYRLYAHAAQRRRGIGPDGDGDPAQRTGGPPSAG